jgi:DNA-binding MarR family transcriptional regulator
MTGFSPPQGSSESVKLLQRIVRLRSHFKVGLPKDLAAFKKLIHASNLSGKAGGDNDAGQFFNVGNVISRYDSPISMGELSHSMEVPLSTATRTMDWLVENGYARRLPDPKDRRIVRVELTRTGRDTYQAISMFMLERVEQALSRLTSAEKQQFMLLLNKVLNAFEEAA